MSEIRKSLISIVIPCYNQGHFLKETLDSVECCADKTIYELIIINDGSTDPETIKIIENLKNEGYLIIDQPNLGLASARNNAIRRATGPYIIPLDADNRIEPGFLKSAADILDQNHKIGVVYGNALYFGNKSGIWEVKDFDFSSILLSNYIDACACFRKSLWQEIDGYDEKMPVMGWEDWDFWLRMALTGTDFHHLNQIGFHYRVREDSMIAETLKHNKILEEYIFSKDKLKFIRSTRNKILYLNNIMTANKDHDLLELTVMLKDRDLLLQKISGSLSWHFILHRQLSKNITFISGLVFPYYKRKILQSGLFNAGYYLENNPDVSAVKINPLKHYLLYGGFEGRNPGPDFNSDLYLSRYPEVSACRMNPLLHYVLYGKNEGRSINRGWEKNI